MKKSIIIISLFVTLFGFSTISYATLMETTFTGQVTTMGTTPWTDGDLLTMTVIYDDAGTVMYQWADGVNLIGEQGGGDDSIDSTYLVTDFLNYTFLDNALFMLDAKTLQFKSDSFDSSALTINHNWAYRYDDGTTGVVVFDFIADQFEFYVLLYDVGSGISSGRQYGSSGNYIILDEIEYSTQPAGEPIPEPVTMLLLGTGLVGVAGAARKRKKNQV